MSKFTSLNSTCIICGSNRIELLNLLTNNQGVIAALYYCHKCRRVCKFSSEDIKFMSDEGYVNDGKEAD